MKQIKLNLSIHAHQQINKLQDQSRRMMLSNKKQNEKLAFANSNYLKEKPLVQTTKLKAKDIFPRGCMAVHLLDCIYYGEINKSYHKEGFGILQTLDFDTYYGFFRNNKAEGLGLIIYSTGAMIYGHFIKDQISGPCIIDNHKIIRVGVYSGIQSIGIGFQYSYQRRTWKMIKYVKGFPVTYMKEQQLDLSEGIPQIMAIQHTLYMLFKNYMEKKYFTATQFLQLKEKKEPASLKKKVLQELQIERGKPKKQIILQKQEQNYGEQQNQQEDKHPQQNLNRYHNLQNLIVHERTEDELIFFGFQDQGGYFGLGSFYDQYNRLVVQSGFYVAGKLDGYARKTQSQSLKHIGFYVNGLKEGNFIEFIENKIEINRFVGDQFVEKSRSTYQQVKKKQKIYNYERKDFLSAKNTLKMTDFEQIYEPPEIRHYNKNVKLSEVRESFRNSLEEQIPLFKQQNLSKSKGKSKVLDSHKVSHTYIKQIKDTPLEKSSVEIIKQKIKNFELVSMQSQSRNKSKEKQKLLKREIQIFSDDDQEIALQENPFDNVVKGIFRLNESPRKSRR